MYRCVAMSSSASGEIRAAKRYMRSRQVQKLSCAFAAVFGQAGEGALEGVRMQVGQARQQHTARAWRAGVRRRARLDALQRAGFVPAQQHVARPARGQQGVGGEQGVHRNGSWHSRTWISFDAAPGVRGPTVIGASRPCHSSACIGSIAFLADLPGALDREQQRDVARGHRGRAVQHAHVGAPAAAPRHHVEVAARAAGQVRRQRPFAVEGPRHHAIQDLYGVPGLAEQFHARALQQHDAAIDAGEGREGRIALDLGQADAPVEVVEARAGRAARQLARRAGVVLPALRRQRAHVDAMSARGCGAHARSIGRFRPCSRAVRMASS